MIERIQKQINSKLIFFSKFHQSDHTHNYLNSLISVLQNQGFPNPYSSVKIVCMEYIKNISLLEKKFIEKLEKFKNKLIKIYKFVNKKELLEYEFNITKAKKRLNGIIGGHLSNIKVFPKYFVKRQSTNNFLNEVYLYYLFPKLFPKLVPLTVKCYGVIFTKNFDFITSERLDFCIKYRKFNSNELEFIPFEK
jgi:hypothetical protein